MQYHRSATASFPTFAAGALVIAGLFAGDTAMALEKPEYTVVHTAGNVEYRRYEAYLVAQTTISGVSDYQAAGNEGFRRLFRYITGNNQSNAKVAMTAPVQQAQASEKIAMTSPVQASQGADGWTVAFMLPGKYTMATAPQPLDPRVEVVRVPERLVAAVRYSGRWTEKNYEVRSGELMNALADADVQPTGEAESALYNAPYVPPFMRRNEVMVEVSNLPADAFQEEAKLAMEADAAAY